MPSYPKRLIEVDLPIRRISEHARREKSIRHGHISTLHIWWARRPLAACRAVICAALWPDPADEHCPQLFRDEAARILVGFAAKVKESRELGGLCTVGWRRWNKTDETSLTGKNADHWLELRSALLDFIADFANWDASTVPEFLETSHALTQAAHEALGGEPGTKPLVVDPFAGGGSIPLEALRVGADAFASDLNPVAVLLNKVVLEYIPKYGKRLADEVRKWGEWIKKEAEKELAEFYPKDPDGATPIAYLWARTIRCEAPKCGAIVPLIRNMQLTPGGRQWHYVVKSENAEIEIDVQEGAKAAAMPTVQGGSATCPICQQTTPAKSVRAQLAKQHGGSRSARLLSVYVDSPSGRYFRNPNQRDAVAIASVNAEEMAENLPSESINPTRPYKNSRGLSAVTRIGINTFGDLYTSRQALIIRVFQGLALSIPAFKDDSTFRVALVATLSCAVSRFIFQNCTLARWDASRSGIAGAFGKQALQVVWDFAESNPISDGPANWDGAVEWVVKVIEANSCITNPAQAVLRARAQEQILPTDSAHALITDPPYFAAIPYSDLSNVFYVWEQELFKQIYPDLYTPGLVQQEDEIIVTNANTDRSNQPKTPEFFHAEMRKALTVARETVAPDGIGVVVFADSTTESWEAILGALIDSGWLITGSWPLDTEMRNRTQAVDSASLQSSIHLVCRPREDADGVVVEAIGDWREVQQELPIRIHDWMPRLAQEGVVGADAIFACLGPALEIFSRYSRVEKASGEEVRLGEYLEHVWGAVAKEALNLVFRDADATGFEPDARLTAMWFWTLSAGANGESTNGSTAEEAESDDEAPKKGAKLNGYMLEYDAARKIAQGLGIHLEKLDSLVQVKGDKARLLPVAERLPYLFDTRRAASNGSVTARKSQLSLFDAMGDVLPEPEATRVEDHGAEVRISASTLDRVHQSMLMFAAGRSEALKRLLVEDNVGGDKRYWSLAQALSALYPSGSDEKRWVDGVLARKKGLGF